MGQSCTLCGKGAKKAASRSHSNIKTLRRQRVNLQKHHGMLVCTRCLKTMTKKMKQPA